MQDKENKKIGAWIPCEIRELFAKRKINHSEMLTLSSIYGLSMEKPCYASNQYFSEFWGFSKDLISKTITSLKRKGYIEVKLFFKNTKEVEKRLITLTDKIKIEPQEIQKEAQKEVAPTKEEPQQEPYKEEQVQEIYKPSSLNAEEIEEYVNKFSDKVKPYVRKYLEGKTENIANLTLKILSQESEEEQIRILIKKMKG